MMRKIQTFIFLILTGSLFISLVGCGDGTHAARPNWLLGNIPSQLNENVGVSTLECVDVTNYKNISIPEVQIYDEEDLTPAEITTESSTPEIVIDENESKYISTTEVFSMLNDTEGSKAAGGYYTKPKSSNCIASEIKSLKKCGTSCKIYWGASTWVLTRERLSKKPKKSEVDVVNFESCEQIKEADCLLID